MALTLQIIVILVALNGVGSLKDILRGMNVKYVTGMKDIFIKSPFLC